MSASRDVKMIADWESVLGLGDCFHSEDRLTIKVPRHDAERNADSSTR